MDFHTHAHRYVCVCVYTDVHKMDFPLGSAPPSERSDDRGHVGTGRGDGGGGEGEGGHPSPPRWITESESAGVGVINRPLISDG